MKIIDNIKTEFEQVQSALRTGVSAGYRNYAPDRWGYIFLVWVADKNTVDSKRFTKEQLEQASYHGFSLLDLMRNDDERRFANYLN